jgi:hypothetical protein
MIPMLASELLSEKGWRVTYCEILLDKSHTDTDEIFGDIIITSKKGIQICFGFTSYDNKKIEMHELSIFNADNIEICMDENDDDNVLGVAYDIAHQTNWRKIAVNTKYETNNRKLKSISFNLKKEIDLLFFANQQKDFSNWVKKKIMEEIYGDQ